MAFERVCSLGDLREGDIAEFKVGRQTVVLVYPTGGEIVAIQEECPHQQFPLAEGQFDGKRVLTCSAHLWEFDITTGKGVNPEDCELARYPVKVEGNNVYVDVEGIQPIRAGA
jgi:toluene monooxygenase system ferredoxin subunit